MIAALILTYAVATTTIPAWRVLPAAVAVLLTLSVWRAARHVQHGQR